MSGFRGKLSCLENKYLTVGWLNCMVSVPYVYKKFKLFS